MVLASSIVQAHLESTSAVGHVNIWICKLRHKAYTQEHSFRQQERGSDNPVASGKNVIRLYTTVSHFFFCNQNK